MSTVIKDLGAVSAYAYAVEKGYTGTEAEFAELMADYAEVGQRAEDAAESALNSKTAAQTAATTATNKASEATTAAQTATSKAAEASTSASTATSAKDTAVGASQTATTKAGEATTAAATATSAATTAGTAATNAQAAQTAAEAAQTGAETAQAAAEDAAESVSASAAQIATNTADITELKEGINENESMLRACDSITLTVTKGTLINGEYVKLSNGTITENSSYSRTDYLPIWYASTLYSTTSLSNCAFYDKAKNFISSGAINSTGKTVPDKAFYIILSSTYTPITTGIVTCIATTLKQQIDGADITGDIFGTRGIVDAKTLLQNVIGVAKYPNNLVDMTDCTDGRYINTGSGTTSSGSNYFCTGYIPVTAGVEYKSNVGRNLAWYDSTKTYISGLSGTVIQSGVTAPTNAAFIRFSVNKTSDGISNPVDLYFAPSSAFRNDVTIDGLIANVKPWCYGKTINWLGDSIVAGDDFDEFVSSALHLTETDYGIGGSTITLKEDGTDGRNACCVRYANMTDDADIIAVSAGTNDWMYAWCPIGTIDDPDDGTSNTTFYGALKTLCKGLIDKYPRKTIFFTTPIKRAQAFESGNGGEYTADGVMTTPFSKNKYGATLMDYADIIKEVCGYYSIPVLDMYRESMLNPHLSAQQDMFDSYLTHPLDAGRIMMAKRVCGWITQLGFNIT